MYHRFRGEVLKKAKESEAVLYEDIGETEWIIQALLDNCETGCVYLCIYMCLFVKQITDDIQTHMEGTQKPV